MKKSLLTLLALGFSAQALAAEPDYSGLYDCKGQDYSEGEYSGTVTLEQVPSQDAPPYQAYRFQLDVPGYGAYPGHAAAQGERMAIYFANTDPKESDYGTGLATFVKNPQGKWSFTKYYYQPAYKGGNHGLENCTQR